MPSHEDALELLHEWVENDALRKHMRSVEAAMRFYARRFEHDEETWAYAGLLHDLDWEKHPVEHPNIAAVALRERGYDESIVRAILAHREAVTGVSPENLMDKALIACDELTGLITATALVRPNGINDLAPRSVRKKMKDAAFARGVDREDVMRGAELLGIELNEHIDNVINAMRSIADDLGLTAVQIRGEAS